MGEPIDPEDVDVALVDWKATAENLQRELRHLQRTVRLYVARVEDGERFDALVAAVPGMISDDGQYPTDEAMAREAMRTKPGAVALASASDSLLAAAEVASTSIDRGDLRAVAEWLHKLAEDR